MQARYSCAPHYTVIVARVSHWKWRETKQQPSRARSGHQISSCFVSLHFLCDILAPITVHVRGVEVWGDFPLPPQRYFKTSSEMARGARRERGFLLATRGLPNVLVCQLVLAVPGYVLEEICLPHAALGSVRCADRRFLRC